MSKRDYYDVLDVARDVDAAELKKAYRKLAMQYHPDRNPDDDVAETNFKEASEAYEVLSNPEKRAIYDRYGHDGLRGGAGGGQGFSSTDDIFSQFGDIFGDIFGFGGARGQGGGGARQPNGAERGADMRYDLELTFEEAVFGVSRTIIIPQRHDCKTCTGTGAKPGTKPTTCQSCMGRGQIHHSQGFFTLSSTCPNCRGAGTQIDEKCTDCRGQGTIQEDKEVIVKVPGGVDTGTRLRLRSEGQNGTRGGPTGDLYVFLFVQPSEVFERDGTDIHVSVDVHFAQAALGCELEVPTLGEPKTVQIKPGTQYGDKITLKNEGITRVNGSGRGDLIVHVSIDIPKKLTTEQRELLEKFAEASEIPFKKSGFFDKLKEKIG